MAASKTEAIIRLETPPFIVMFPNLFKAKRSELSDDPNATPKFGVTAVFDSSIWTEEHKDRMRAILRALEEASQAAFKKPWDDLKSDKKGLRRNKEREVPFDFVKPDAYFANLTTTRKPGIITLAGADVGPAEGNDDLVYQGCLAKAKVNVFDYDNKSKGVALGLFNVQLLVTDPKLAPRRDNSRTAAEDFNEEDESEFLKGFEQDEPEVDESENY